ncbi:MULTISPECIES: HD-GYP domain-containing protein [Clostridium]|uniref:HD-GYP domain-containing protein n=1 Tax=Clostridium TaxID=1485 RepID=UPI0006B25B3E|nr:MULTISPECIES: HD domain-containing protein [Clostridium]KOY65428.1 polyketide cyclase [Clostridium sporogenes]MDS1006638.1 HD domain-containing protein [Clostridium sporogenes]OPD25867.1 polyketide cyclase [Clostridium botulinum]
MISPTITNQFNNNIEICKILKILQTIKEKDINTYNHSINVAKLTYDYCVYYDLDNKGNIFLSALLHDTGKIFIDPVILNKPGKLTNMEFSKMQQHPILGYEFLKQHNIDEYISQAALLHHIYEENKGGYPKFNIVKPDYIRLISICDSFEVMTCNDRPYQNGISIPKALEEIKNNIGIQFDNRIANKFIDWMKDTQ